MIAQKTGLEKVDREKLFYLPLAADSWKSGSFQPFAFSLFPYKL
jgi:hypothetical protein